MECLKSTGITKKDGETEEESMVDRLLIKNAAQIVTPEGKSARHGREMKQLKIY